MTEQEIDKLIRELQGSSVEMYSFVAENCDENLTDDEIDDLVTDLESDYLSLREFVINALVD
ncbi:hypothetical protein [Cytobacillus praedii]|uniref:hypothetical protein n=1 Tax=Cytobacillus praedii TaxID=1742358 RepID=UPI002E22DDCE|nr:hypothetical protein [Cytobacillus praedii]